MNNSEFNSSKTINSIGQRVRKVFKNRYSRNIGKEEFKIIEEMAKRVERNDGYITDRIISKICFIVVKLLSL